MGDHLRALARLGAVLGIIACLGILPAIASAQAPSSDLIGDVVIEGTERIEPSTVISYMTVREGDPFDQVTLDETLKSLFATGLFADVTLRREGDVLLVRVVENPIINRIAFEGNLRIDDEVLEAEVQLRPRVVFTRTRVQNDVARLLEVYRRSGRFAATIEPQVIQLDQNRVDLVFEIDEGPLTGIEGINFVGNRAFSDSTLRGEVQTRESAWWRILSADDRYDPDRLAFDRELLRRFYLSEGYADFRVISAVAELTPDGDGFFMTFTLDEGERYTFGDIGIETQLPNLDVEQLRSELTTETGDWYSSTEVEESIAALTALVGDLQYAFVDVRPLVSRNRADRVINVTYQIEEGPRVFVDRIEITGNVRTVDRVIRREMELVEGDPFNTSKLRRSETRIRNLGFFERVDINPVPADAPDRTTIQVEVAEQSTGEFNIGAGFSTADGPIADVSLRERNLLGRGQDLRIGTTVSGRSTEIDLSFTEPYFLERDLSAGFDIFRITRDNQDESSFDESVLGFGLRAGYPLADRLRQVVNYRLAQREVEDVRSDASRVIRAQEGETIKSSVGHQITYDQLDSRIEPSEGYILRFGNEFAGLGGDVRYVQTTASANVYFPIFDEVILSVGAETGYIVGLGEDVAINDRFFVGGSNLRGFARAGVGARDAFTDDALGANRYAVGSVELTFPLGLPEEFGLRGRTFTDFGTAGGVDDSGADILDEESLRMAVGAGLSWTSPFGPIRIDLAFPVLKEDFDDTEVFRFSFGTRF
ncbi:MAG: outer membrane protein assembly factor BamA [Inquilinaceae bacterium]